MTARKETRDRAHFARQADEAAAPALRRLNRRSTPLCWADERAELQARLAQLEGELGRARRCVAVLRLTLTEERRRARECMAAVVAVRDQARAQDLSRQYLPILAVCAAKRTLHL